MEKYPGKRAIRTSTPYGVLEIALMADGVPMSDLYPLDVDRAFKKLDTIKDHTIFYSTNEQGVQLLSSGQASIGLLPNGRAYNAKNNGQPLDTTFNGGVMFIDYWVVPKGAPNAENAMKFINAVSDAEGQREIGKIMAYGGNNPEADAGYDEKQRKEMPTSAENEPKILKLNGEWWSNNLNDVFRRWQTWLLQ
jgi:putative spermidine/putrescine transport system substrate-binding protein